VLARLSKGHRLPGRTTGALAAGVVGALLYGAVAGHAPGAALLLLLLIGSLWAVLAWPDAATLAVLFLIYTNAAVIAVQVHGLPFIVGASVPLALVVPLLRYVIVERRGVVVHPALGAIFAFFLVNVFGALFSSNPAVSTAKVTTLALEGVVLYVLLLNAVRSERSLRYATWTLLVAGAFLGGLSAYQQVTGDFDNTFWGFAQVSDAAFGTGVERLGGEVEQPRLGGPLGQQNRYAQIMLMLFPLGLFRFWGERSPALRLAALGSTLLITLGMALTFSRGAAVGLALLVAMMSLMGYIKPRQLLVVLMSGALVLVAVPQYTVRLSSLGVAFTGLFADPDTAGIAGADGAVQSRLTEGLAAALMFADAPILGVGPGMYKYFYQTYAQRVGIRVLAGTREPHTLYLGVAAENGLLGVLALGGVILLTLLPLERARRRWASRNPDRSALMAGYFFAVVAYLATGLFLHFAYIRYFWLMMALAGAAGLVGHQEEDAVEPGGEVSARRHVRARGPVG